MPEKKYNRKEISMWRMILIVTSAAAVVFMIYLIAKVHGFSPLQHLGAQHSALSWLAALAITAAVAGLSVLVFNMPTAIVTVLHLGAGFLLCDIIFAIAGKITGRTFSGDVKGLTVLALVVVYMAIGWFLAHHVFVTNYTFYTNKQLGGDLRIAVLADSHLGITLDGEDFAREMEKVQAAEPDLVIVAGDFVDDDSKAADMKAAAEALGTLKTKYGVYFVYGNHDNGYYRYRDFSSAELRGALTDSGVVILEDESLLIDGRFYMIGRRDRSTPGRAEMSTLMEGLDESIYSIVADHQPNDYAAEAAAGADLVVSGHTHGGHVFPAGQIGLLMHANDRIYGTEVRGDTTFAVTSGISGWAIPFKTGTKSEIVIIDIKNR